MKQEREVGKLILQIKEMDKLVRAGQHGKVRRLLFTLNLRSIPRPYAASLADIARRVNAPRFTLLILRPIVKSEVKVKPSPSTHELALYATGLSRLGAYAEAHEILMGLDTVSDPDVILFLAYNFMFQWDFASAIPKLKEFLARDDITFYTCLVGQVNLAACLSAEMQWSECEKTLANILSELRKEESGSANALLYANSLEIAAQLAIKQGQFEKSKKLILEAEQRFMGSESRYEIFVKKWKSVLDVFSNPQNKLSRLRLQQIKNEGIKAGNWEVVRDLEFYEALAVRDDHLFLRVYFGTPHSSYRQRIKKIYNPQFIISKSYDWHLGSENQFFKKRRVFDLTKGCELGGTAIMSETPLLLKLMQILTIDFYRPIPLGVLISELYPGDHYNPISSPIKANQAIKRLRNWFKKYQIPLKIQIQNGTLKLTSSHPYTIRIPHSRSKVLKNEAYLERLKNLFQNENFTTKQVSECLDISSANAQEFLKWAKMKKQLIQLASGRSTRYRLKI